MSQVAEEKLLEEHSNCTGSDADERVVEGDLGVVLIALGVVEV